MKRVGEKILSGAVDCGGFSSSRKTSESSLEMKAIKNIYIINTGDSLVWFLLPTRLMPRQANRWRH